MRTSRRPAEATRDDGAVLIMALALLVIGALIVIPLLTYTISVSRSSMVSKAKTERLESVKGGLRAALADPTSLYKTCNPAVAGTTVSTRIGAPPMKIGVTTDCFLLRQSRAEDPAQLRYGLALTGRTATYPASMPTSGQKTYPSSAPASETTWTTLASTIATTDRIWLPELATHGLNRRSATPLAMPAGFTACQVFFPGTYTDPITISGSTPVFFTSGIYYFESVVTFAGSANVVVGAGSQDGCTDDQEAAFNAVSAPATHNITGLGATFVFGGAGRLVIDNSASTAALSVVFNKRYAPSTDIGTAPSGGVSVVTVNGAPAGGPLSLPGQLFVPASTVAGTTGASQAYVPSTVVATATTAMPIVSVTVGGPSDVSVLVPGYVAVPQGLVSVNRTAVTGNSSVRFESGVLSSQVLFSALRPTTFAFGLVNPFVQRTFKLVTSTSQGNPVVTSTAVVQVNENGAYAINSWEVG